MGAAPDDRCNLNFLRSQLSAEAQASLERSGGADAAYLEEMYLAHTVAREKAMRSLDLAAAWSRRAGTYQMLATVLAVGLAFAAWASLMEQASRMRWVFAIVAALVLLASLGFLGIHLVTREPIEEYLAETRLRPIVKRLALPALQACTKTLSSPTLP